MIWGAIETAWHFLFGWAGIDMLIGFGCVAIAVLMPKQLDFITDLRKWAIGGAVVAFTFTGLIAHGYKLGINEKQRQWDAAVQSEADRSAQALDDAVRDVGPVSSDRCMLAHDRDNRNRDGIKLACR